MIYCNRKIAEVIFKTLLSDMQKITFTIFYLYSCVISNAIHRRCGVSPHYASGIWCGGTPHLLQSKQKSAEVIFYILLNEKYNERIVEMNNVLY